MMMPSVTIDSVIVSDNLSKSRLQGSGMH